MEHQKILILFNEASSSKLILRALKKLMEQQ